MKELDEAIKTISQTLSEWSCQGVLVSGDIIGIMEDQLLPVVTRLLAEKDEEIERLRQEVEQLNSTISTLEEDPTQLT